MTEQQFHINELLFGLLALYCLAGHSEWSNVHREKVCTFLHMQIRHPAKYMYSMIFILQNNIHVCPCDCPSHWTEILKLRRVEQHNKTS